MKFKHLEGFDSGSTQTLRSWLTLWVIIGATLMMSCTTPPRLTKWVDLTHSFGQDTIYWPTNKRFQWEKTAWGTTKAGFWYASANYAASEHGGTHLDAPIHFAEGRRTLDQIPLKQLIGPGVVIDVRTQCDSNPDHALTVQDILAWESLHGPIRAGSLVFMRSGWETRWPDPRRYLGSATPDDPATLHFPGFSQEAAEFLVSERQVKGVGIDTASIDPGQSVHFPAHRVFSEAEIYALENVAALDQLPPRGGTIFALPMKIEGGTGGPVRLIAQVP